MSQGSLPLIFIPGRWQHAPSLLILRAMHLEAFTPLLPPPFLSLCYTYRHWRLVCSATRSLPRVQTVRNPAAKTSTELSSWTATLSSAMVVDCTMTSKPGMGSGSRQGLHELQVICGMTAHQRGALSCSSALLFLLLPTTSLTGHASIAKGSLQTGPTRSLQGKMPKARNVKSS